MTILKTIINEAIFRLAEESLPRIKKCFSELTDDEIWTRPNQSLGSLGNLILHLEGNVRQYILFGLGDEPDKRERQSEFDHSEIIGKEILLAKLDELMIQVKSVLKEISLETLTREHRIQGMTLSGFGIVMHVVEHFSYHVGQITWHTKLLKEKDLKYYGGKDLNITG